MDARKESIRLLLVLLAGAGVIAVVFFSTNAPDITVLLKWKHNAQFAGMYVAEDKGYYKDADLSVILRERADSEISISNAVSSGEAAFGIMSTTEFLSAIEDGRDLVAVAAFFQNSPSAIVSLAQNGIKKPADLRGKIIGVPRLDRQSTLFVSGVLETANLDNADVTYKKVGFDGIQALMEGTVDAVALYRTSGQYALDQTGIGYAMIFPEDFGINTHDDILVTTRAFADSHLDVVRNFVSATRRGWSYALSHKDEAIQSTLARAGGKYKDEAFERFILENSEPLMLPKGEASTDIGRMSSEVWDETYDLYRAYGLVRNLDISEHVLPLYFFKNRD